MSLPAAVVRWGKITISDTRLLSPVFRIVKNNPQNPKHEFL